MNDAKTQIIDKLKSVSNILVTVSTDPSVDQLAACVAMTMLLNKSNKNATAVFSGKVPSVIDFLHPKDTIETTTDSLRDFIIAIDKSKADKLRYKLEDDVVKIFITPYKTSITESDLKYSAGDFNVELIIALGVKHQQDLDTAITAHGRIFHDAVTMSINNEPGGDFGVANWEDLEASSLSELVANLIKDLNPSLLDADIATALLTGIVAETSRFSNDKTHPHTLSLSSELLAAGADQQLVNRELQDLIGIVVNLQAGDEIAPTKVFQDPVHHDDVEEELVINENGSLVANDPDSKPEPDKVTTPSKTDEEVQSAVPAPESDESSQVVSIEDLHPTPVESTKEPSDDIASLPVTSEEHVSEATDPQTTPNTDVDDAESARKAVEDALGSISDTSTAPTQPSVDVSSGIQPELNNLNLTDNPQPAPDLSPSPLIMPIADNQPSYSNPATITEYDTPTTLLNEPAPLGMSPADQAFTMPMPPMSSMSSQAPPTAEFPANQPPTSGGMQPPPLPPPLPPPSQITPIV